MSFLLIINIPWPLCIISFLLIFYILYINIVLHLSLITNIFFQLWAYLLDFFFVLDSDNGYSVWQMAARVVFSTGIFSVHCPQTMVPMEDAESTLLSTHLEFFRKESALLLKRTHSHPLPILENHFLLLCAINKTLRLNFLMKLTFNKSKVIHRKTWCCFNGQLILVNMTPFMDLRCSRCWSACTPVFNSLVKNNVCLTRGGELWWHLPCELLPQEKHCLDCLAGFPATDLIWVLTYHLKIIYCFSLPQALSPKVLTKTVYLIVQQLPSTYY